MNNKYNYNKRSERRNNTKKKKNYQHEGEKVRNK